MHSTITVPKLTSTGVSNILENFASPLSLPPYRDCAWRLMQQYKIYIHMHDSYSDSHLPLTSKLHDQEPWTIALVTTSVGIGHVEPIVQVVQELMQCSKVP